MIGVLFCLISGSLNSLAQEPRPEVSEIWALIYDLEVTDGNLDLDSDGDGLTGFEEARFGTDPNDRESDLDIKVNLTSEGLELRWDSVKGIRYQVEASADLETWTKLGNEAIGNGTTLRQSLTPVEELFIRLRSLIPDDKDSDGLNDYEEHLLQTDPMNEDTDGDRISDFLEFNTGTDPLVPESSGMNAERSLIACGPYSSHAITPQGNLFSWGEPGPTGFTEFHLKPNQHLGKWRSVASSAITGTTLAIDESGTVFQLSRTPEEISFKAPAVQISVGGAIDWVRHSHRLVRLENGSLWAWGSNMSGQLGLGHEDGVEEPTQIIGPSKDFKWRSVTAGGTHTLAIGEDGSIWAWGSNEYLQLGTGSRASFINKPTPVGVDSSLKWKAVSAGTAHSCAIADDGSLWTWGANHFGALGIGVPSSGEHREGLPVKVNNWKWSFINAGEASTGGITDEGNLFMWGYNGDGLSGHGADGSGNLVPTFVGNERNWKAIDIGAEHVIGLKNDGSVWTWGENSRGRLGNGFHDSDDETLRPRQVGAATDWKWISQRSKFHQFLIKDDNSLWGWGSNRVRELQENGNPVLIAPSPVDSPFSLFNPVDHAAPGHGYTLGIGANGDLWFWGQLVPSVKFPGKWIDVVADRSQWERGVGLREDGSMWRITGAHRNTGEPWPVDIERMGSRKYRAVSGNGQNGYAIDVSGKLYAWGWSERLGVPQSRNQDLPILVDEGTWSMVSAGGHVLALKSDTTIWAWGDNDDGQLGDGTLQDRQVPIPLRGQNTGWDYVSAGGDHSLAIKEDGSLWAWGDNFYGQFGNGTQDGVVIPIQVSGEGVAWRQVYAGEWFSYGIRVDGSLWAWGRSVGKMIDAIPTRVALTQSH